MWNASAERLDELWRRCGARCLDASIQRRSAWPSLLPVVPVVPVLPVSVVSVLGSRLLALPPRLAGLWLRLHHRRRHCPSHPIARFLHQAVAGSQ